MQLVISCYTASAVDTAWLKTKQRRKETNKQRKIWLKEDHINHPLVTSCTSNICFVAAWKEHRYTSLYEIYVRFL
jgi:hypothetical protein